MCVHTKQKKKKRGFIHFFQSAGRYSAIFRNTRICHTITWEDKHCNSKHPSPLFFFNPSFYCWPLNIWCGISLLSVWVAALVLFPLKFLCIPRLLLSRTVWEIEISLFLCNHYSSGNWNIGLLSAVLYILVINPEHHTSYCEENLTQFQPKPV